MSAVQTRRFVPYLHPLKNRTEPGDPLSSKERSLHHLLRGDWPLFTGVRGRGLFRGSGRSRQGIWKRTALLHVCALSGCGYDTKVHMPQAR